MYLEITVAGEEPKNYPIKNRLLIGSSEPSDIIVARQGVSRKHLLFLKDNDKFYIVDQGSTNGTYLEEKRVRPGQRQEITTYLPVRISRDVLICLVDERSSGKTGVFNRSETTNLLSTEVTSVISLKELKESQLPEMSEERKEKMKAQLNKRPKKVVPARKKFDVSEILNIIIAFLVCAVIYLAIRKRV